MTMNHCLFLAAGFLPVLIIRRYEAKLTMVTYNQVLTQSGTVQREIVTLHNTLRRGVVPSASNMLKMNWNEEAAQNARNLSQYCDLVESNALKRRITNTFCGENKQLTSYLISWSNVIEIWYNESKYFKHGEWPSEDEGKTVDHYTQLVWATSYLIGCGVSLCCKRITPQYLYVCHYCHEGNEPDKKNEPYQKGSPCGDCPYNCEDKLCTNPCVYYDEHTNCKKQKKVLGCQHPSVQLLCKATCLCHTEIK
ncbi:PREDICTED: cysteine-rich secretory protein 1 [Hipposideros armiger]|uniref:Cysteine-rich secretory protein 1 n=1 Tax=Hipposideros armiger TaxID=186990 RepID=A0A8B7Q4J5_HIPAR|nr:PREDICTED: cysteine-rich secretory protein 1 [Hipposideros armiger]